MSFISRARYYQERLGAHLEAHGCPLRRRSLLFYEGTPAKDAFLEGYRDGGIIKWVSAGEFRALAWRGNPVVTHEAVAWSGPGKQLALVAVRGSELDGFCWLESEYADLRFFDLIAPLPHQTAYFSRVWVLPEMRSTGIGRKLLRHLADHAASLGLQSFVIACDPHNARVRRLAADLGYRYSQRVDYLRAGPLVRYAISFPDGRSARFTSVAEAEAKLFSFFGGTSQV